MIGQVTPSKAFVAHHSALVEAFPKRRVCLCIVKRALLVSMIEAFATPTLVSKYPCIAILPGGRYGFAWLAILPQNALMYIHEAAVVTVSFLEVVTRCTRSKFFDAKNFSAM